MGQVGAGTALDVEVRKPPTKHAITLQQVERLLSATSVSPLEKSKKAELKLILVQG
jgi:hypothetical protein